MAASIHLSLQPLWTMCRPECQIRGKYCPSHLQLMLHFCFNLFEVLSRCQFHGTLLLISNQHYHLVNKYDVPSLNLRGSSGQCIITCNSYGCICQPTCRSFNYHCVSALQSTILFYHFHLSVYLSVRPLPVLCLNEMQ